MDESARSMMMASIHLSTIRWTTTALRRLREYSNRLELDLQGAKVRADMTEGKLVGRHNDLLFWYYPQAKGGGALYLVQECAVCRKPFPTEVQTPDEVEEFERLPPPDCRPDTWTWAYLRHRIYARRAERDSR
jgi:hypothetical protein